MTCNKSICGLSPFISVLVILVLILSLPSHQTAAENIRRPAAGLTQHLTTVTGTYNAGELWKHEGLKKRDEECREVHHAKDKCTFIRQNCGDESVGVFDYLGLYYCEFAHAPALALTTMAVWLGILFTTLGIAASDFFCINLSTIASILGMSESMAGVTFLAFGNGSPDVFSTFAAMKIDSGSLAVGELIGAASFIVAVVAGSMAIVRPFKVARRPFVRDVTFFVIAILFGIFALADGEIHMWECIVMVLYYLFYVVFVCIWHWWTGRRRRIRLIESQARDYYVPLGEEEAGNLEDEDDGGVGTSETTGLLAFAPDIRLLESQDFDDYTNEEEAQEQLLYAGLSSNMRVTRGRSDTGHLPTTPHSIRPSLVGAMEFRSVLHSGRKTQDLPGKPIHLRRYSDNPALLAIPQRSSAPGTLMHNTPVGSFYESSSYLQGSSSQSPWSNNAQRARAVSVNDIGTYSALESHSQQREGVARPHSSILQVAGKRRTGLTLAVPSHDFLAPRRGLIPDTTASSPVSSISPSSQRQIKPGQSSQYRDVDGDGSLLRLTDSLEESIPTPTPLGLSSDHAQLEGDIPGERLLDDAESGQTGLTEPYPPKWRRFRYWPYDWLPPPQLMYAKLFPTLQGFWDKSQIEKLMALMALPSVFLLTITLPVVEDRGASRDSPQPPGEASALPLEAGSSQCSAALHGNDTHAPNGEEDSRSADMDIPEGEWNRWLHAIQCICSPVFVMIVFLADSDTPLLKPFLYSLLLGLISLLLLLTLTSPTHAPKRIHLGCYIGFIVAISWISTIANEVVGVLKSIGVIFNISDAILGLTIFAMGNSLGDLVADITIAKLGYPVMALSACFGGPMLNILLGVGISGIWIAARRGGEVYKVQVSSTLIISAGTLLVTLVFLLISVPANGWKMSRRIGWMMIALWGVSTVVNLGVEVGGLGRSWG